MNIFYLHHDPRLAAQDHCDKHVGKMLLEGFQLLSTAHHVWNSHLSDKVYKVSHRNHPSSIWCRQTTENYFWLYRHFRECCKEYTRRYGKYHLTDTRLSDILVNIPKNIPKVGLTKFAQAMPDYCKREDPVDAYRVYYLNEKRSFAKWTNRDKPDWWKECA